MRSILLTVHCTYKPCPAEKVRFKLIAETFFMDTNGQGHTILTIHQILNIEGIPKYLKTLKLKRDHTKNNKFSSTICHNIRSRTVPAPAGSN